MSFVTFQAFFAVRQGHVTGFGQWTMSGPDACGYWAKVTKNQEDARPYVLEAAAARWRIYVKRDKLLLC